MPELPLAPLEMFAAIGLVLLVIAVFYTVSSRVAGIPAIAAALSAGFGAYSLVTVYAEGWEPLWLNHTTNLWGVQVWWDLLLAVGLAFFLLTSRARAVGMNIPAWAIFVVATASIGLLAMAARLFWLEGQTSSETDTATKPQ